MQGKRFSVDLLYVPRNFFASVNTVLSNCKFVSDMVKLELLEKHCLPLLMYCVESLSLSVNQIKDLNIFWNSVYRKIFNYNRWESVKLLISLLGRLDMKHLIHLKSVLFLRKLQSSEDELMKFLCCTVPKDCSLHSLTRCEVEMGWSSNETRRTFEQSFKNSVNNSLDL